MRAVERTNLALRLVKARAILVATLFTFLSLGASAQLQLSHLGTYATGIFNAGGAEIADFDPSTERIFFVNAQANQVVALNASNPASPTLAFTLSMAAYGNGTNSVKVLTGGIAVAVEATPKTDPGKVVFFDLNGVFLSQVTVGALPDMVTVTPDGTKVLCANEGEPNDSYTIDPVGSISIIDITGGLASLTNTNVTTLTFAGFTQAMMPGVRIFGQGATVAQDMEPEYIAFSDDSQTAFVGCQENNAVAKIDLATNTITQVTSLGYKDHSVAGFGIDASDNPANVNIANWPVRGLYMPDAIATYTVGGQTYVVYANEGDAREWGSFVEPRRIGNAGYALDATAFPNAATLKQNANLGRLNASIFSGDTDSDGDFDQIYVLGSRSFSIRDANGALVFDSGDDFEQITSAAYPTQFNSNNSANGSFDTRSDDKGPEPEAVAIGEINGHHYAFIGLERIGGIMVYDITAPSAPVFIQYLNHRNFTGNAAAGTALDLGVESVTFVSAANSPTGEPLIITGNEISGTVSIFRVCVSPVITSISNDTTICSLDTLELSASVIGSAPLAYSWSGTGTFVNGNSSANASVVGAATGTYSLTVTNACGNDAEDVAITVNTANTYYADFDSDGLGDPAVDSVACTQPEFYVLNNDDLCPVFIGQMGDPCSDGNINTINDVVTEDCICAGTPVVCTQNEVTLVLNTDGNAVQTTWDIVNSGTTTAVCSGGDYANNSTITVTCCLPNGCYDLRVFDSFGDGINPGGYLLKDVNNKSIIDNVNNGAGFTTLSEVRDANNVAQSFCVPLGVDQLTAATCGNETANSNTVIQATINAAVSASYSSVNSNTGYQWWFFNPNGGYSRRIFQSHAAPGSGYPVGTPAAQRCSFLKLSAIVSNPLPLNTLLNVRVRSQVNGLYSSFGAACRIKVTTPPCATTQLTTTALPTNPTASCGATVNYPGGVIYADAVAGANKYQFNFTRPGYTRNIASNARSLTLAAMQTNPLSCGFTYDVKVRVSFDGGATYCPYGVVCPLTLSCPASLMSDRMAEAEEAPIAETLHVWPNPNDGEQLFLSLDHIDANVRAVSVEITDLFGRRVYTQTIAVEGRLNTALALDHTLAGGVYVITVIAGESISSERIVIQ